MTYFRLSADFGAVGLLDADSCPVDLRALGLSDELLKALASWNDRYQPIIPLEISDRMRRENRAIIADLDREGLLLAAQLADKIGTDCRVEYFSEGQLRRVPPGGTE